MSFYSAKKKIKNIAAFTKARTKFINPPQKRAEEISALTKLSYSVFIPSPSIVTLACSSLSPLRLSVIRCLMLCCSGLFCCSVTATFTSAAR